MFLKLNYSLLPNCLYGAKRMLYAINFTYLICVLQYRTPLFITNFHPVEVQQGEHERHSKKHNISEVDLHPPLGNVFEIEPVLNGQFTDATLSHFVLDSPRIDKEDFVIYLELRESSY